MNKKEFIKERTRIISEIRKGLIKEAKHLSVYDKVDNKEYVELEDMINIINEVLKK